VTVPYITLMRIRLVCITSILFVLLLAFSPILKADHTSGVKLSVGGRLKIDAIYNYESVGGTKTSKSDLAFSPGNIPVPNSNEEDIDTNLRESRLWATLTLPLGKDKMSTYVEFDFFDTKRNAMGRSHVANDPRMRHLYASFKNLTAGKTYSTFANISSYPEINDANGPLGVLIIRRELIRYNASLPWGEVFLALEKGKSTFTSTTGSSFQVNDNQVPDIIGKVKFSDTWGNMSVAAMFKEINADDKMMTGINDRQRGVAFSASGRIYLPKQDNLRFALSYGNALGRHMSFNAFDDATIDSAGKINLTEIVSAYIAYQHWWTNTLRSSLIVGAAYADQDTSVAPSSVDKLFTSSHLNLLWSPTLEMTLGLEWLHGYRKLENGQDGNIDRLQFSVVYKF